MLCLCYFSSRFLNCMQKAMTSVRRCWELRFKKLKTILLPHKQSAAFFDPLFCLLSLRWGWLFCGGEEGGITLLLSHLFFATVPHGWLFLSCSALNGSPISPKTWVFYAMYYSSNRKTFFFFFFFCGLGSKGLVNDKMTRLKTPKPVLLS